MYHHDRDAPSLGQHVTLFPLDSIRNASIDQQHEPRLYALRERVSTFPWWPDSDGPDVEDILTVFDAARPRLNVFLALLKGLEEMQGADISTGFGFLPVLMRDCGFHIKATERDVEVAGFAARCGVAIHSYCIGTQSPPFAQESLDYLIFAEVMEHLKLSPAAVIRELASLLRPNGIFLLSTPNVARRAHVEALVAGENFLEPFPEATPWGCDATDALEHVREYSVREVVEAVEAAGLAVDQVVMTGWADGGYSLLPNPYANEIIVVRARR
ncbi:MAG: hypothetical protein PVSMB7_08950 [Chloroflexota bacterium]